MSKGFFLTTRGITSHPLFRRNPNRLAVWMWLLDNAAWKETTHDVQGTVITVPRGAVCASTRQIADEVGVGHQVVRTAIERFKTQHMINTDVTHGKTIISLCNYEKHQAPDRVANTASNTAVTQRQHSGNTQKEQGNKENNIEGGDTNVSPCNPVPANDVSEAVTAYNLAADSAGWPQVQKMNPNRSRLLRARLAECGGIEGWEVAMKKAQDSDFLSGRTAKPWTGFSFDWAIKAANFTKLMEGNYDNRDSNSQNGSGGSGGMAAAFGAVAARRSAAAGRSGGNGGRSF